MVLVMVKLDEPEVRSKPEVLEGRPTWAEHERGEAHHERGDDERDGAGGHHRLRPLEPLSLCFIYSSISL